MIAQVARELYSYLYLRLPQAPRRMDSQQKALYW